MSSGAPAPTADGSRRNSGLAAEEAGGYPGKRRRAETQSAFRRFPAARQIFAMKGGLSTRLHLTIVHEEAWWGVRNGGMPSDAALAGRHPAVFRPTLSTVRALTCEGTQVRGVKADGSKPGHKRISESSVWVGTLGLGSKRTGSGPSAGWQRVRKKFGSRGGCCSQKPEDAADTRCRPGLSPAGWTDHPRAPRPGPRNTHGQHGRQATARMALPVSPAGPDLARQLLATVPGCAVRRHCDAQR
jgi:hypothetical protein